MGTVVGSMLGLPGNGRRISFRIMHVFEFRDGLVSHENVWLDTGSDDPRTGMPGAEPEFGRREDPSRRGRFVPSPRRITATSTHTGHELCRALHCARVQPQQVFRAVMPSSASGPLESGPTSSMCSHSPARSLTRRSWAGPTALVLIIDPEHQNEPATTVLRRLYRLTATETEVALRISRGKSLVQIANELSMSYQTIRTHLQHVFDKTDTHRQGEVVRLLLADRA